MKKRLFVVLALSFFLVVILGTQTFAATLIGHWGFEEGSGLTAFDSTANSLDGAIYNAAYTAGKVGSYALDFNGANSYVEIPYDSLLNPDTVSISLWFKPRSSQVTSADILDKGHGYGTDPYFGGYVLQYYEDFSTIDAVYGNNSNFYGLNSGGSYNDFEWHHIVAILGAEKIALYMDGGLVLEIAGAGSIVDNDSPLFFGRHRTLGRYFNGLIDEVRIYEGALTGSEVAQLHAVPVPAGMWLLGSGLAGLIAIRRKLRK